jgi:L-threonylcarbamoyladenylate synthase
MDFESDIVHGLDVLRQGGLILFPTDTVWGIGCDATNPEAVARIYALKQRPENKALIVLVTEEQDVLKYVAAPDLALFDHLKTRSKSTTVIYAGAIGFADNLIAADGSIAIRICADPFCRHLIKRFGKPIVSTSANRSGQATPAHFGEVGQEIRSGVDYVVRHRQSDTQAASSSTVIKWENGAAIVIRP